MKTRNALELIKKRLKEKPDLQAAYYEEKKNYYIACKIREYRKRAKLTQKKLAQLIGTKQSVVSRLENAEYTGHSLSVLKKISAVLNEPLENFLWSEHQGSNVFTLHLPQIISEAASFRNWKPALVVIRYRHAK